MLVVAGNVLGSVLGIEAGRLFLDLFLRPGESVLEGVVFVKLVGVGPSRRLLVFNVGSECRGSEVDTAQIFRDDFWVVIFEIHRLGWICKPTRRASCTEELRALGEEVVVDCESSVWQRCFAGNHIECAVTVEVVSKK